MLWLYSLTIFLGAFLLFLVQPLFARMALPLLGGAPAVWNVAMVFYQATLLAGYAYAHVMGARSIRCRWWHLGLMLTAWAVLPLALPHGWVPPVDRNPMGWLLGLLAVTVGLPFFFVSATNPLLQRWFAAAGHGQSGDPYFLSVASNTGSLLALLAYPLVVERTWMVGEQTQGWAWGYGALMLALSVCALAPHHAPKQQETTRAVTKISNTARWRWVGLAFVPSSLMLSVTTYMTTEIGSMPLLWIIPLSLYLFSFIIVFSPHPWFRAAPFQRIMPLLLIFLTMVLVSGSNHPALLVFALHLLALMILAIACHGAMAESRPSPEHLTEFYLWMSVGGVLGGIFNALLAPLCFTRVLEYPITLVLAAWWGARPDFLQASRTWLKWDVVGPFFVGLLTLVLVLIAQRSGLALSRFGPTVMFGLPLLVVFSWLKCPHRFALGLAAIFLGGWWHQGLEGRLIHAERSFYGVHRVLQDEHFRRLVHGSTVHGTQNLNPILAHEPISYYARTGPLGQMMATWPERSSLREVGAIGLGVGSIAAYARPGEQWTFFELDPSVYRIASDPRYFQYLRDCAGTLRVILGDGRLTMQRSAAGQFDLIVLDAYSSDALPVHLLTQEAFRLYAEKLRPGGLMAFHISNRYLELEPIIAALVEQAGWHGVAQEDLQVSPADMQLGKSASHWVVVSHERVTVSFLQAQTSWHELKLDRPRRVWTDQYSSLWEAVRWKKL